MSSALENSRMSTPRGSPSKGSRDGVRMSQNTRATALCSPSLRVMSWNVLASGNASMSDSSRRAKPSTAEPSKPTPSSKASSSSSGEIENDLRLPSTSVNHRRTKRMSRSSTVLRTKSILLSVLMQTPFGATRDRRFQHHNLTHLCYGAVSRFANVRFLCAQGGFCQSRAIVGARCAILLVSMRIPRICEKGMPWAKR